MSGLLLLAKHLIRTDNNLDSVGPATKLKYITSYLKHLPGKHDQASHSGGKGRRMPEKELIDGLKQIEQGQTTFFNLIDKTSHYVNSASELKVGKVFTGKPLTSNDFANGNDTKPWEDWSNKLDVLEKEALINYASPGGTTDTDFSEINKYLRGIDDPYDYDIVEDVIDNLDSALEKGIVSKDTVAFRGFDSFLVEDLAPGDLFTDEAYVSTSVSRSISEGFDSFVAEIRVPKGSNAGYVDAALNQDDYDRIGLSQERELLLPRDSRFRILSKDDYGMVMELLNG